MSNLPPTPHHFLGKYTFQSGDKKLVKDGKSYLQINASGTPLVLHAYEVGRLENLVLCYLKLDGTDDYVSLASKSMKSGENCQAFILKSGIDNATIVAWEGFTSDMKDPSQNPDYSPFDCWHVVPVEKMKSTTYLPIRQTVDGYLTYEQSSKFSMTCIQKTNSWYDLNRQKKTSTKDFTYVDFTSEKLSNLDLSIVDFGNACFNGTQLNGATLNNARFINNVMTSVNLGGAKIEGIELPQTSYENAWLNDLDLRNMDLSNCSFLNAHFDNSTFSGKLDNSTVQGAVFKNAKLSNVYFSSTDKDKKPSSFVKTDFSGVNLSTCHFQNCDLTSIIVDENTVMTHVDLQGATLRNTDFSMMKTTDWGEAEMSSSVIDTVNLSNANLRLVNCSPPPTMKATYKDNKLVTRLYFTNGKIRKDMLGNNWDGFELSGITLDIIGPPTFSSKSDPLSAKDLVMDNVVTDLSGSDFSYADFSNAEITGVTLNKSNFSYANLNNTYLKQSKFNHSWFVGANLTGAYLIAKVKQGVTIPKPMVNTAAQFTGAYMLNVLLDSAHCDGVSFDNALIVSASIVTNPFSKATNVSAKNTSFILCAMDSANLSGGVFEGAVFNGAKLTSACLVNSGCSSANFQPSKQFDNARADLGKSDIRGTWFCTESGDNPAQMQGADITSAKISDKANDGLYTLTIPDPNKAMDSGATIIQHIKIRKTMLGNTDGSTSCPDGSNGPCKI